MGENIGKIPIRKPTKGLDNTRLANNIIFDKNSKIIIDMLVEQQKALKDYNGKGKGKLDEINSDILDNFYRILENTNCKRDLIIDHNKNYKHSKKLWDLCASDLPEINKGSSIESDFSKDVISEDFRKCKRAFEDEKMQKVAFWANRIAHGCKGEIGTFTEQYMGVSTNDEVAKKKKSKFLKRISDANEKFDKNPEYRFNQSNVLLLLNREDFDFDSCTDPDFVKAKELMENSNIACRDKSYVRNFIYCNRLQTMTDNFYAFKDNAVENLIEHLNDPSIDDEDKNIVAFRIEDKFTKDKKGESMSRIVLANKTMYEEYLQYNDSLNFPDKYIESFSKSGNVDDTYGARDELKQKFSDRYIENNEINALMEKCSVSSFHVPDKALDKFLEKRGLVINDTYPPIIECMAYNGGHIYDITPSQRKEKGLETYLKYQCNYNKANKKKNKSDPERFYSDKKIVQKAKLIVEEYENINTGVIGGGNI